MKSPTVFFRLPLLAILALTPTLAFAGEQDNARVEGSLKDVRWGQHWAGPAIKEADLEGKVVLLKIWGG